VKQRVSWRYAKAQIGAVEPKKKKCFFILSGFTWLRIEVSGGPLGIGKGTLSFMTGERFLYQVNQFQDGYVSWS
jgi:hypothetical protein